MEKIKVFILKSPVIMGIITFVSACILAIVFKLILGLKSMSLETTVIPLAIASPLFYTYHFKEQIKKAYRVKYALTITLLYALSNIFIILHLPELAQPKLLNMIVVLLIIFSTVIYLGVYFITGRFGKKSFIQNYPKAAIAKKNLPSATKKQINRVIYLLVIFLTLMSLAFELSEHHIINISDNMFLVLGVLFFGVMYYTLKYLKKTSGIDFTKNTENDKDQDS